MSEVASELERVRTAFEQPTLTLLHRALRFRLGDEMRSRPRFAPVFLDEGFVKADSEFAGRAVGAWKGLGFQLVIGVPLDKVTGLEPHMDALLVITKHTETHRSTIHAITDAQRRAPGESKAD